MVDLILSINKVYANAGLVKIRQDDYGQTITAIITDKANSPLDLSKSDLTLNVKDWNGEIISDLAKGDASGNVTYTINNKVALATGSAWFEIKNDPNRVATQTFWLQVEEAGVQEIQLADPLGGIK